MFHKIDGFIKIHDEIGYLVLFDYGYCDKICDKIKYLLIEKSGITDSIIIILPQSHLTHMILSLMKKY